MFASVTGNNVSVFHSKSRLIIVKQGSIAWPQQQRQQSEPEIPDERKKKFALCVFAYVGLQSAANMN